VASTDDADRRAELRAEIAALTRRPTRAALAAGALDVLQRTAAELAEQRRAAEPAEPTPKIRTDPEVEWWRYLQGERLRSESRLRGGWR
jgi:hypothetical protein